MVTFPALCFKPVGFSHQCSFCHSKMHKHGKSSENKQRYRCTSCGKTQVEQYSYAAYHCTVNQNILALIKAGVGIRGIARLLQISTTTVLDRIKKIAERLTPPPLIKGSSNEVDELCTFVQKKKKESDMDCKCLLPKNQKSGSHKRWSKNKQNTSSSIIFT